MLILTNKTYCDKPDKKVGIKFTFSHVSFKVGIISHDTTQRYMINEEHTCIPWLRIASRSGSNKLNHNREIHAPRRARSSGNFRIYKKNTLQSRYILIYMSWLAHMTPPFLLSRERERETVLRKKEESERVLETTSVIVPLQISLCLFLVPSFFFYKG